MTHRSGRRIPAAPCRASRLALLLTSMFMLGVAAEMAPIYTEDFEVATTGWTFNKGSEFPGAEGRLEQCAEAALEGTGGLRLHFDFTGGGAYVAAYFTLPTPADISAVNLTLRKPSRGAITFRASDSAGQTCQKPLTFRHDRPQRLQVTMDRWAFSWGGPADRRLRQPVTHIGILIEQRELPPDALVGYVDIDNVVFLAGTAVVPEQQAITTYRVADYGAGRTLAFSADKERPASMGLGAGSLLGDPLDLELTLSGVSAPVEVSLDCASHFQGFRRSLGVLQPAPGRQVLTVAVPPSGWEHFGGENDGQLNGPIRMGSIGLKAMAGKAGDVTLERLTCRTRMRPDRPVILIPRHSTDAAGTADRLDVDLVNLSTERISGTLVTEFRDETGSLVGTTRLPVSPAPGGTVSKVRIEPYDGDHPVFDLLLTFFRADGSPASAPLSAGFAHLPPLGPVSGLQPESPWGMGTYLYRYANDDAGLARMDRAAALAQAAGVKWSREEILWHRTEPRRGEFDFTFYDKVLDCANTHGISVYGLLTYWSKWTQPYTEEGVEDYCRWVRRVVEHYKDRIHHWEIWNEPNIFFWSGPKELYPVLLKQAYTAIKEVDPSAKVLGCSTAGIDTAFVQRCLDAEAPFDILTIHPYRGHLDDQGFIDELKAVARLVDNRPVWITEMGWPTQIGSLSELQQAQVLARCYLGAAAAGDSANVSWYDFREDGTDPFYNEHSFGAVRYDLQPKAAYIALHTLCNTLGPVSGAEPVEAPDGLLAYRFEAPVRAPVLAVWSGEAGGTLLLENAPPTLTVRSLVGRDTQLTTRGGKGLVALRPSDPIYLLGAAGATLADWPFAATTDTTGAHPGESIPLRLTLQGFTGKGFGTRVDAQLPAGWEVTDVAIPVPATGKATAETTVRLPETAAPGPHVLAFTVVTPLGQATARVRVEVLHDLLVQ